MNVALGIKRLGRGKRADFAIDALVLDATLDGIGAFSKNALHPFVEEKAWAKDEFINHAHGKVVGQFASGWSGRKRGGGHIR